MRIALALVESTKEGKEAAAKNTGRGIERPDATANPHYWVVQYFATVGHDLVTFAEFEVYDQKPTVVTGKFNPYELDLDAALAAKTRAACE